MKLCKTSSHRALISRRRPQLWRPKVDSANLIWTYLIIKCLHWSSRRVWKQLRQVINHCQDSQKCINLSGCPRHYSRNARRRHLSFLSANCKKIPRPAVLLYRVLMKARKRFKLSNHWLKEMCRIWLLYKSHHSVWRSWQRCCAPCSR
jgi:hypothetical protein